MKTTYSIADVIIAINTKIDLAISNQFCEFISKMRPDYVIDFEKVDVLPDFPHEIVFHDNTRDISIFQKKVWRCFYDSNRDNLMYAIGCYEIDNHHATVWYVQDGLSCLSHSHGAFFHIGWEDILLNENRLLLHACCIETHLGGICFSGPSGIGKSTQGDLWRKYENAALINGDRPILYKDNQKWFGYGSPYAGSSKVHINRRTPLKAIILLEQSKACSIKKMEGIKAFQKIFSQLTISHWNKDMVNKACCLVEQLINDIPIYELSCTPDKDAVDLLKSTLLGGVD